ncbi:MAG: hypothetical protein R2731_10895 [Nocardioides sp.]
MIYQQGDRLTLEFELVCPPRPDQLDGLSCGDVTAELTVTAGEEGTTVRTASTSTDQIAFTLPESATSASDGLAYTAEFTLADGTTVDYPAQSGSMSAISISTATEVDLGTAQFSVQEQDPGELVVNGGWGDGPDEFGINEQLSGPPSFDIDPTTGDIVILDQMNSRIVRVSANGKSVTRPIQLHTGAPDLAVAPDGTLDVLWVRTISGATLERFAPSGGEAIGEIQLATPSASAIRRVDDAVWVEGDDSYWMRVSQGEVTATPAEQVDSAASGMTDGDHLVFRKHLRELGNEVRIADVGPSRLRAWRLTGKTALGPVALAAPLPDGRVVVVQSQFDNDHSQYTLLTLDDEQVETRVVPSAAYAGTYDPSEFRLVGTSLYQTRSTKDGFAIYRYQLSRGVR